MAASLRIAHLADIHIQDRRRDEYAAVFDKLYTRLAADGPDVIVVAGDVFDNKMRASAHNLEDVARFLSALADIAPVVLTAGNHDTNCLTPGSLDLLSPLLSEHARLQPPRLIYQRHSGKFSAHGVDWVVKATDGDMPEVDGPPAGAPRVLIFHEEVNGASLPNGTVLDNYSLGAGDFAKFTAAMGGHIHKRQMIAPNAAYCGSLVQQNIGESHVGHGYLLWTIGGAAGAAAAGVDIYNLQGYLRVEVGAEGEDCTALPLPTNPHYWEVMHDREAGPAAALARAAVVDGYRARYAAAPRAVRLRGGAGPAPAAGDGRLGAAQEDARSLASQYAIIREILGEGHPRLAGVLEMHKNRAPPPPASERARVRVKRLEFDNMYSYKKGNVVDFTRLENCVSGIIAPNHAGKSSLIEALAFVLYDAHPRAGLKSAVVHSGATHASAALDFEIDGRPGRIEKWVASGRDTRAHHNANPYRLWFDGEELTQGGTPGTLAEAAKLLGTVKNSLVSSFSLQNGEGNFINSSCAERKQLLASALSLGSFEQLERATAKEMVALNGAIKALEKQFGGVALGALEASLAQAKADVEACTALLAGAAFTAAAPALFAFTRAADLRAAQERLCAANATALADRAGQHGQALEKAVRGALERLERARAGAPAQKRPACIEWARERSGPRPRSQPELAAKILLNPELTPTKCAEMVANKRKLIETLTLKAATLKAAALKAAALKAAPPNGGLLDGRPALPNGEPAPFTLDELDNFKSLKEAAAAESLRVRMALAAKESLRGFVDQALLSPDCAGCASVLKACSAGEECDASGSLARQRDAESRYASALAHNLRLDGLALAKAEENLATFLAAIQWLETEAYWGMRDVEEWDRQQAKSAQDVSDAEAAHVRLAGELAAFTREAAAAREAQAAESGALAAAISELEGLQAAERAAFYESVAFSAEADFNRALAERNEVVQKFAVARESVASLSAACGSERLRSDALDEAVKASETLYAYRSVIKPSGGIADKLLERARDGLTLKINAALVELGARFEVDIEPSFEVAHRRPAADGAEPGAWISVSLASGYQRFILGLATRLAIWRLATATLPDALIIDEGFGACDEEYLASLGEALEALADTPDSPRLIFIVSHVDVLKARLERALTIDVTPEGSVVSNSELAAAAPEIVKKKRQVAKKVPAVVAPADAAAAPADAAAAPADAAAAPADAPADKKTWHCVSCLKDYAITYKKRHLASVLHLNTVKVKTGPPGV